jgi:hypothetical protein
MKNPKKMKTTLKAFLFLLVPITTFGVDYSSLATAVGVAESNSNTQAVGDSGKARGAYQMWRVAWEQASLVLRKDGSKTYPWAYAHDAYVSRQYAITYLRWCGSVLEARMGRKPVYWEVYAAYARGPQAFAEEGYSYDNLPVRTKRAINIIAAQMKEMPPR